MDCGVQGSMNTQPAPAQLPAAAPPHPQQRVIKVRRDYNAWVARESLEDYVLRFTPRSFRKWSEWRVAHTALGGAPSFLVLEAVGATLLLQFGFVNAALAILATAAIIFAAGLPISVYAARHGLDIGLLTRGAGLGYVGSTITSLVHAALLSSSWRWKRPSWPTRWNWPSTSRLRGVTWGARRW
jgi:hypothetical protein